MTAPINMAQEWVRVQAAVTVLNLTGDSTLTDLRRSAALIEFRSYPQWLQQAARNTAAGGAA